MQGHVHAPFRPLHSDDLPKLEVVKCGSVEMGCIMMVRERVGTLVDTLGQRYAERFGGELGRRDSQRHVTLTKRLPDPQQF